MHNSKFKSFCKFIFKLSLCLIPVAIWYIYILCFPFYYMDSEYSDYMQQKNYVNQKHESVDMLIIGDSTGKSAMIPSEMEGISAENICLGGSSSIEMYYSIQTYLQNNEKPKYIVCVFHPDNFQKAFCFEDRTLFFRYLNRAQLKEVAQVGKSLNEEQFYGKEFNDNVIQCYLCSPKKYLATIFNSSFTGRKSINDETYEQIEQDLGHRVYGTAESSNLVWYRGFNNFVCSPVVNYYFEKIIELCNDNDIQFIFETPKVNEETFEFFQETTIKEEYEKYLEDLSAKYESAIIDLELDSYTDDCFGDATHLNPNGQSKFTQEFMQKFNELFGQA